MEKFLKNQQIPLTQVIDPNTGQAYYSPQNVVYDDKTGAGPTYLKNVIVDQATSASYFSGSVSNAVSASYALTASYVAGLPTSSISSSYALSASYASTASYAFYAETASSSLNSQDILIYVKNQSGAPIAKGVVVRITGSNNSSDIPRVVTASYINDNNSANTLGITNQSIANGSEGYVITEGILKGINTNAFTSGQLIYLGATGSIIGYAPVAPLHAVRLGEVVREQSNNGSIYVRIDNGYELDELHDVLITSASSGDLLIRSASVWINSRQLTGSYAITGSLIATSFTGSFSGSGTITSASFATTSLTASFVNPLRQIVQITGSLAITSSAGTGSAIYAYKSGSTVLDIQGSQGQLFSVTDALSGSLMSVNDVSGLPILEVFSDDRVVMGTYGAPALTVSGSTVSATGSLLGTASYATTALSASYAPVTPTFPYTGSALITGSLGVTGSIIVTQSNANYAIQIPGLTTKQYFQSPTTNQGSHTIAFGFGGAGEQVKFIANAAGASGRGNLYIASTTGDTAVATTANANALFTDTSNTFYKSFTIEQSSLTTGNGLYLYGNQPNSIINGIYFRYSETRVAILSKPHGSNGYADFRIAIVPVGGANNPPVEADTKFMITKDTTNVLINTTTDAGFKLDVSGSGRFTGNLTITGSILARGLGSTNATTTLNIVNSSGNNIIRGYDDGGIKLGNAVNQSQYINIGTAGYSIDLYAQNAHRFYVIDGTYSPAIAMYIKGAVGDPMVGIKTIDPSFNLDVSGSGRFTNNLTVTGSLLNLGSLTVGNITSTPSTENSLNVYPPSAGGTGEGGQILLAASGGLYSSASMIDNWQNQFRILRGSNTGGSNAGLVYVDLQSGNTQFVGAVTASAYSGLPNDYLYVIRRSSNQTIGSGTWANRDVIFDFTVVSKGISYDTSTGLADLVGGKVYRITSRLAWSAGAAYLLQYSCYDSSNNQIGPIVEIVQSSNGTNNISDGTLDFIYAPVSNIRIKIRTTNNTTALTGEQIRNDLNTQFIIQQIA